MFSDLALVTILLSFAAFTALNTFLEFGYVPIPKCYSGEKQPKWKNTVTSLVNSLLGFILSMLSLPALWPDFVLNYTTLGEVSMAVFLGYQIYDCIAMIKYQGYTRIWAILLHHAIVIGFLAAMLYTKVNLAYSVFSSTIEVNSFFLHVRLLLVMYGVSKRSPYFRLNNILYITTFVLHRLPVFLMTFYFAFRDRDRMSGVWNISLLVGNAMLCVVNVYFFRIVLMNDMMGPSSSW